VRHGQSIQAAVNHAHPGDTIVVRHGVYHEAVQIRKNNITLRGHHAVIVPPAQAPDTLCAQIGLAGICVLAKGVDPVTGAVSIPVRGVHISGFTIRDFPAFGILAYGSHGIVIKHNHAYNNAGYGIVSFVSSHNKFLDNVATGAEEAGFYYGDSPHADALIHGNVSHDNALGFFLRNASHGVVRGNKSYENCVGLLVLAGAPGPAGHWTLKHNNITDNDRVCAANEEAPPLSGIGVLLSGSNHVRVLHNWINDNHPKGDTVASGGVLVMTSIADPSFLPHHNLVKHNVIRRNKPYDVFYDGTGSHNRFPDNWCGVSVPEHICG
jgi:parallel beta-helix repeat protein